jgi:hypothetical protein
MIKLFVASREVWWKFIPQAAVRGIVGEVWREPTSDAAVRTIAG